MSPRAITMAKTAAWHAKWKMIGAFFWKGSARLCAVVLARKQQQKLLQMCDPHRLSPVLSVALTVVYCASHLETG